MKRFFLIVVKVLILGLLLSVFFGCAQGDSASKSIANQGSGGTGTSQNDDKNITPTAPAIGGARIKVEMYALIPGAGGTDVQEEEGDAFLVFDRQDGPPKIFTVHGSGTVTWKEETDFEICSWKAEASGKIKVEGVLDPYKCQAQLVITEVFDDPVMTSVSGQCGDLEFTSKTYVRRVDLPLVNNASATTGSTPYDLKVTIFDILLDDSISCVVPE